MKEIKCPKCGDVFKVDESGYNAIANQVKDKEFEKEIKRREELIKKATTADFKSMQIQENSKYEKMITDSTNMIENLKMKLEKAEQEKKNMIEIEKAKSEAALEKKLASSNSKSEKENTKLKMEIEKLKGELNKSKQDMKLAINEESLKMKDVILDKEKEIAKLKLENKNVQSSKELELELLAKSHLEDIAKKNDQIDYYKDLKMKQSTKMLGETLEQHCEIAFNQVRHVGFQGAYFEKDNDAKSGSKGDYIFKDFTPNGNELISIMFEMKNEDDRTATKKKNEDFLKELDKDRREKGCEYAVLVSLLEQDNDYYNTGIVDVSHKYPKMFVIRPQFFIQIITLLRNASQNAAQYKDQLVEVKNQNIDISNFENEIELFKSTFGKSVKLAGDRFNDTIKYIDDTINSLQKAREELRKSVKHLNIADGKANDLTIQRLTKDNPTMIAKFKELD